MTTFDQAARQEDDRFRDTTGNHTFSFTSLGGREKRIVRQAVEDLARKDIASIFGASTHPTKDSPHGAVLTTVNPADEYTVRGDTVDLLVLLNEVERTNCAKGFTSRDDLESLKSGIQFCRRQIRSKLDIVRRLYDWEEAIGFLQNLTLHASDELVEYCCEGMADRRSRAVVDETMLALQTQLVNVADAYKRVGWAHWRGYGPAVDAEYDRILAEEREAEHRATFRQDAESDPARLAEKGTSCWKAWKGGEFAAEGFTLEPAAEPFAMGLLGCDDDYKHALGQDPMKLTPNGSNHACAIVQRVRGCWVGQMIHAEGSCHPYQDVVFLAQGDRLGVIPSWSPSVGKRAAVLMAEYARGTGLIPSIPGPDYACPHCGNDCSGACDSGTPWHQ